MTKPRKLTHNQFMAIHENYNDALIKHRYDTLAFWDYDYVEYRLESEFGLEFAEALYHEAVERV